MTKFIKIWRNLTESPSKKLGKEPWLKKVAFASMALKPLNSSGTRYIMMNSQFCNAIWDSNISKMNSNCFKRSNLCVYRYRFPYCWMNFRSMTSCTRLNKLLSYRSINLHISRCFRCYNKPSRISRNMRHVLIGVLNSCEIVDV